MHVKEAIERYRTVKAFDPEFKMTNSQIDKLLALALHSSTAFNLQNWRFVVMKDKQLLKQVRALSWDQAQITEASVLLILCADLQAWEKEPIRYWRTPSEPVHDFMLSALDEHYIGLDLARRDEAMRSCGIAAQSLMLAATSLGYDSCAMDGFNSDEVGILINLPPDHAVCMFVAIGKALVDSPPKNSPLPLDDVIIHNTF